VRPLLERHVEHGITKFVLVPLHVPQDWDEEVGAVAAALGTLQGMPADGAALPDGADASAGAPGAVR